MKTAYDLAMELVQSTIRLEELMNKKQRVRNIDEDKRLDKEIDNEDLELHRIKDELKSIKL